MNNYEKGGVSGISGSLRKTYFGTSLLKPLNTVQAMSTDLNQAGGGCGQESETGCKEGRRTTRIGPSRFSRETGMVLGANSATAQCGEWKEDEWQELLARLATVARFEGGSQGARAAEELEHAVSEHGFKSALIDGYSNVGPDESVQYLDDEPVLAFWEKVAKHE